MKTQILKRNDKLLVTQEFIDHLVKVGNVSIVVKRIWQLGDIARVDKISDYSTVRVSRGVWSVWINNNIAESMRNAYLEK